MERVLNLITSLDRGGAETMIMNYYRHIDRSKVQFDFLVNRKNVGAYEQEIQSLGGRIYRMGPMYPLQFNEYKRSFRNFLHQHPEYRIIHSHLEERSYFPLRIAKEERIPVRISHAHNAYQGFNAKTLFRDYFRFRLPPYPTHRFACSEEAGIWLYGKAAMDSNQVSIIHNAIDGSQYTYSPRKRNEMRAQLGLSNSFVLGNIGRMAPQKNQAFLLDIFATVHSMHPHSKLIIMGTGELEEQLHSHAEKLHIANDVIFAGSVPNVPDYLQTLDVFLLPSLFEGLPVSLIEAQASGLPALAADTITRSSDISGHVEFLPLKAGAQHWAREALKFKDQPRIDAVGMLREHQYDINTQAAQLQQFYLDSVNHE